MSLTEREAYLAMFAFLAMHYERTQSDDVGSLLGSMSLLPDGKPADRALWQDWLACLERVRRNEVNAKLQFH